MGTVSSDEVNTGLAKTVLDSKQRNGPEHYIGSYSFLIIADLGQLATHAVKSQ
ncbi:MAG: hypothetical protein VKJ04_08620 [Vampirovibrionales bacterium]|nr:hypothetical protein [Vampirovibrionales bacterium]